MKIKIFRCKHCGNTVIKIEESGVPMICCGEAMTELVPNTTDGAHEKHVPVFETKDGIVHVKVGEVEHPMAEEHYIQWIAIQTTAGSQIKHLKPGEKPEACFAICEGEEVEEVFEYCNIHGFWAAKA